ncbi:PREDICTED: uncharacterized protein LOC105559972 [Vollenhovia emeryi]|uniref:uncharacterized protein LOC105559972 n=1 Tax=Vollenhovia emeryi TaxID=411798 RepID=UPI0005F4D655|nr:PREDICTED: uncharacterized protein LOC105559972 [Vollenhovia emeryi]
MTSTSPLLTLGVFVDEANILRVGGRLKHASLPRDERHPIVVPPASQLALLLVDACHRRTLHGGVQLTLGLLRLQYWLPRGRAVVKRRLRQCVTCVRWRGATIQPPMGNLPRDRVTPARPFLRTGVDYAGPVFVRTSKGRGQRAFKAFIAVFVCFCTKAVHLELVSDYTSEAFLAAFRRFTSRRGLCSVVYSDCGTNFTGADKELQRLFQASSQQSRDIARDLANQGVKWHFNPPAAPHFGGLWEAAVKSAKHHLRRVIGEARLTFEELTTLLAQIEACLNSRPLRALSDDLEDITALTPGHFLVGSALLAIPEPSLIDTQENLLSRWRNVQRMRDHFWARWSSEYLHGIASRPKWHGPALTPDVGALCLIRTENTAPTRWPLARITRLHPGDDGIVRVVTVRTGSSTLVRPLTKIVPLPGTSTGEPS